MAEVMAWPLNLEEYAYNAEDVMRWMAGRTSGIYGQEGNWQVIAQSGMNVRVQAEGMAGGWLSNLGRYGVAFWNPTNIDLTVETADGVLPRIDRVVVSWHIPQQTTVPDVVIRKGTPLANPQPPALVNNGEYAEICLAEINVPAGATEITSYNITDTRLDESLCGLVSMGVEKIPTDGLEAQFMDWFENVKGQLSGDVAGNLQEQINQQGVKKLSHSKSGTTHALTGLSGVSGTVSCVFTATAAYAAGDTFTVDGVAYTIQLSNGEEAGDDLFVSGASVPVVINTAGKKVNFKAAGGQKLPAGTMDVLAILTQNGTFIVPQTGIYKITAIGHGGFGGFGAWGRDSYTLTGGGGAAGGIATVTKDLKKGESYTITVNDSQSSFGNLVTAIAGGNGSGINPGIGGSGSGDQVWNGGNGIIGNEISSGGGFVNGADGGSTSSQAPFGGAKGSPGKIAGFKNPPYNMVEDDSIRPYLLNDRNFGSIQNKYFGFGAGCGSSAAARTADGEWVQVITGHDTDIDYPMGANGAIFVEMVLD